MKSKAASAPSALIARARRLYLERAHDQAREICQRLLRHDPDYAPAEHLLGLMDAKEDRLASAAARLREVVRLAPGSADYWGDLGMVLRRQGVHEAAEALRQALVCDPGHANSLCHLAEMSLERGDLVEAARLWNRALLSHPDHFPSQLGLARLHQEGGRPEAARLILERVCARPSVRPQEWRMLAQVHLQLNRPEDARVALQKAAQLDPLCRETWRIWLRVCYKEGDTAGAMAVCRQWQRHFPGDAEVLHMLAAFGGAESPAIASPDYIRTVFDPFAESFDDNLARLGYRAPAEVARLLSAGLHARGLSRVPRLLDAGCGTGLSGVPLRPLTDWLEGVDLSSGMLAKARQRGVYDALHEGELVEWLGACRDRFDAATCVDTLMYFGDTGPLLAGIASVLLPGGQFVSSSERHEGDDAWRLGPSGRYTHSRAGLENALRRAGFIDIQLEPAHLRHENGLPVPGWLFRASRPAGA